MTSEEHRRALSRVQRNGAGCLRWLVRTYSEPGDLVVDPCAGSGSAGEAAHAEGRRFRGWDTDARFGVATLDASSANKQECERASVGDADGSKPS